jgi:hypothetical protein
MSNPVRIGRLLYNKRLDELTAAEEKELADWRRLSPENEQLFRDKMDPEKLRQSITELYRSRDHVFEEIKKRYPELDEAKLSNQDFSDSTDEGKYVRMFPPHRKLLRATLWLLVGSAILVIILRSCGIMHKTVEGDPDAIFTSPEGVQNFDDEKSLGFHMGFANIDPVRTKIGGLDYYAHSKNRDKKRQYEVSTAKKGNLNQVRLILPDSTWIWLNRSTWIKYPVNFEQDSIHIALDGEGYFEGIRDSLHPYIISLLTLRPSDDDISNRKLSTVNRQPSTRIVIAASTAHFDVNAYSDSSAMVITAIIGNIFIRMDSTAANPRSDIRLFAGQQVEIKDGKLNIIDHVDIERVLRTAKWYTGN